jgi:hypothetical protein
VYTSHIYLYIHTSQNSTQNVVLMADSKQPTQTSPYKTYIPTHTYLTTFHSKFGPYHPTPWPSWIREGHFLAPIQLHQTSLHKSTLSTHTCLTTFELKICSSWLTRNNQPKLVHTRHIYLHVSHNPTLKRRNPSGGPWLTCEFFFFLPWHALPIPQ